MNDLKTITNTYNNAIIEAKYQYAINLLDLLTDEQYESVWEDYPELFNPISEENGSEYIRNIEVLDAIIKAFLEVLKEDPKNMSTDDLVSYLEISLKDSEASDYLNYFL